MPALRDTLRVGYPALGELNAALPTLRAFSREALPGVRSSVPTLDAAIPWIVQARGLVGEDELKGLAADLRQAVPQPRQAQPAADPGAAPAARAVLLHELGAGAVRRVADPEHRGRQLGPGRARQIMRSFVGLAGESRVTDANTPVFHIQGVSPLNLTAGRIEPAAPANPNMPPPHRPGRALRDAGSRPTSRRPAAPRSIPQLTSVTP